MRGKQVPTRSRAFEQSIILSQKFAKTQHQHEQYCSESPQKAAGAWIPSVRAQR
jgi:hypothetical protein